MGQTTLATYLPVWAGPKNTRQAGFDEDAVTLAVAAGLLAIGSNAPQRVVVITQQPVLLEGGSAAVLCAGLGLPETTEVVERLGGAATALDSLVNSAKGTLVIGVDTENGAGAGAALIGDDQAVRFEKRVQRSLPVRTHFVDGTVYDDDDPRLVRERAIRESLVRAELPGKPKAIAGLNAKTAKAFCEGDGLDLPTIGASSPFFALAALAEETGVLIAAMEQASLCVVTLAGGLSVVRHEPEALPLPKQRLYNGPDIKISLPAYDRAFDAKLKLEAGKCNSCGTLAMPPRYRCLECGSEANHSLTPLPRQAEVYTNATIHVPVPGLKTPYSLVVAQLQGVDVRILVTVTDAAPGTAAIGDKGTLVFRRIAVRSGVPDYGYAFAPEVKS